jgi:hypothetical protein
VIHCGYSLQDGRRSVNNFCADFSGNKFHAKLHLARRLFSVFAQVFGPA